MSKRGAAFISVIAALAATPALARARDSDHDGLPNAWEKGKAPGGLNLKKLGASPKHRDVFVQFDYAKGATSPGDISCGGLTALAKAYAGGPLQNPDGKKGIRLHIDANKKCAGHDYDLGGSRIFKVAGPCANFGDLGHGVSAKRAHVFHVGGVVTDSQLCGAEGVASDTDFIVKTRGGGNDFAYVVMHELGHVFGLFHGIHDDADVPIDKFSVMSGSLAYGDGGGLPSSVLDYQRYPIPSIDESSLDESAGFSTGDPAADKWLHQFWSKQYCLQSAQQQLFLESRATGPIDFDCDGAPFWVPPYSQYIDSLTVAYDINGDGQIGILPAVPAEWPELRLGNGRIGG
jgi:hypothetical protein